MKRMLAIFGVLVTILTVGIGAKVWEQRRLASGASGGSGVVEGTRVRVTSRIPARVERVEVREGETVEAGRVLAVLDCREQNALRSAAQARLDAAQDLSGLVALTAPAVVPTLGRSPSLNLRLRDH